jgi:hypothetical protein
MDFHVQRSLNILLYSSVLSFSTKGTRLMLRNVQLQSIESEILPSQGQDVKYARGVQHDASQELPLK